VAAAQQQGIDRSQLQSSTWGSGAAAHQQGSSGSQLLE
jgi:hypothetical protein